MSHRATLLSSYMCSSLGGVARWECSSLGRVARSAFPNFSLELLEISDYADQSVSELSGGTRRKVSVALTIIGDSQTIILDEPSCGLDPKSRKELRKVIKTLLEKGKSVLLSSHSMEECASLCQR